MHTPHTPGRARPGIRARMVRAAATVLALASLAVAGPAAVPAQAAVQTPAAPMSSTAWEETELFHKINGVRWLSGTSPIYFHGVLGDQARAWSGWMRHLGHLAHHPDLGAEAARVTASWTGAAEIVGRGPDVVSVLNAFLASPPHRSKILGDHRTMGVGIVRSGGELWVTVRFLQHR